MSKRRPSYKPDAHRERVIAVEAMCDPRTVRKYLMGHADRCNATARERIRQAIEKLTPSVASPPSTESAA